MVDYHSKTKIAPLLDLPEHRSPKPPLHLPFSSPFRSPTTTTADLSPTSLSASAAYDRYLRLPDLQILWNTKLFPSWNNESLLVPALQALEITFRFISLTLSDPRPYSNSREWSRRLESLAMDQVEIISLICEDEESDPRTRGSAPIVDLRSSSGVLARDGSSTEVWKVPGETATVVSRTSEGSLLPRLAAWHKSEQAASRILYSIERAMLRCPYTLGVGESNLSGKPNLDYDAICRPSELHGMKRGPLDHQIDNAENQRLYTIHQILEAWIQAAKQLLGKIDAEIIGREYGKAASDCWLLERIWKLAEQIEALHLLMDPDDFLKLKALLKIKAASNSDAFCSRSKGLIEITRLSKDLRRRVPEVLGVVVDPMGGPVIQEAAMRLYREKGCPEKIHLLQGMQAVEAAMKGFFYAYKQVLVAVMGSLEANGNHAAAAGESCDVLSQMFLGPTYYPSLDGAKTFLGYFWEHHAAAADKRR
ncbi:hypothetical protein Dimus_033665 [Dionaea muscipula]